MLVEKFTTGTTKVPEIHITVEASQEPISASLTDDMGVVQDVMKYMSTDKTRIGYYDFILPGTNPDGIMTFDVATPTETLQVSVCSLTLGTQYLLSQVLKKEYDCVLMQNLEAIKQLIMANQSDVARDIYEDVRNQAASCTDAAMLGYDVVGTTISIIKGNFVIK